MDGGEDEWLNGSCKGGGGLGRDSWCVCVCVRREREVRSGTYTCLWSFKHRRLIILLLLGSQVVVVWFLDTHTHTHTEVSIRPCPSYQSRQFVCRSQWHSYKYNSHTFQGCCSDNTRQYRTRGGCNQYLQTGYLGKVNRYLWDKWRCSNFIWSACKGRCIVSCCSDKSGGRSDKVIPWHSDATVRCYLKLCYYPDSFLLPLFSFLYALNSYSILPSLVMPS